MKFAFLAGGFAGFLLAALSGLLAGRASALVLRDAALGCLAGAFLFRWFWSMVVKAMAATLERRRAEARAASETPAAAPASAAAAVPRSR